MRCLESCVSLWWHIDQLYVLGRRRASQAEAARAYKTLLTKLQGKLGWAWVRRGGAVCDFCPCLLDSVWMCDYVCLSWREAVPQHLEANLGKQVKVLESGATPCQTRYTTTSFRAPQSRQKVICTVRRVWQGNNKWFMPLPHTCTHSSRNGWFWPA